MEAPKSEKPKHRIPEELRETMLDFTIAYLLECPTNVHAFALGFFERLQKQREGQANNRGNELINTSQIEDDLENPLVLDDQVTDWMLQFSIVYIVERPRDIVNFGIRYANKKLSKA